MQVDWIKCSGDKWCPLINVDLSSSHFDDLEGVYVIWHSGDKLATVRVGQGMIRDRLSAHRQDPQVHTYAKFDLYGTWAKVNSQQRDGVEAFLADKLNPLAGERLPSWRPIQVNLPW